MGRSFDKFEIDSDTELIIEGGKITTEERDWLQETGILRIRGHTTETGDVSRAVLNIEKLSRLAFEYELLKEAASSVEIDILEQFRRRNTQTLTTGELTDSTGRPKSSISRALSRLTEKNKLVKVQPGVYRYQRD